MDLTRREFGLAVSAMLPLFIGQRAEACDTPPVFYDADGLIVHQNMDGGDTAQREGWYWLGVWIRKKVLNDPWPVPRKLTFDEVLSLLEPGKDGIFYRHPKLPPWNNPHDKKFGFSRDQMVPLVAAMGVWGFNDGIRRLWNALPQDVIGGTKHTFNGEWLTVFGQKTVHTGDIVSPATVNLFKRAWNEAPNDPVGEQELVANSALRANDSDRDNVGDDLNHIVMLLMSILRFPSETSGKAVHLYSKNRVTSYGSFLSEYKKHYGVDIDCIPFSQNAKNNFDNGIASGWQTDASRVYGAVRWYHRKGTGANPALADIYQPIIRHYLE